MIDAIGGQVPLAYSAVAGAHAHVKSGKLTGVGVSMPRRVSSLPDVATFIEQGVAGFDVSSWVGIMAPAKTPKAVTDKLNATIAAVLKEADVRERFATLGVEPVGNTPEQFGEQIKADLARWQKVVEAAKIKQD